MYRGTTPTINFKLNIDIDLISDIYILFSQGGDIKFTKYLSDCEIDEENNTLSVTLENEETLSLEANKDLHIQLKVEFNDGKISYSKVLNTYVDDIIDANNY